MTKYQPSIGELPFMNVDKIAIRENIFRRKEEWKEHFGACSLASVAVI